MKKQWNKDIRDQLKDFPKKAPKGLLEDIKSEMLRRGLPSVPATDKHPRIRSVVMLRIVSVAAFIAILLGFSILWEKQPAPSGFEEIVSSTIVTPAITDSVMENSESAPFELVLSNFKSKEQKFKSIDRLDVSLVEADAPIISTSAKEENRETEEKEQLKEKEASPVVKEYVPNSSDAKLAYHASSLKKSSWSVGVYFSGMVAQFNPESNGDFMSASPPPPPYEDLSPVKPSMLVSSRRADVLYKLVSRSTHRSPVKLGVSVRYRLDERWNLQSGLTYSYLSSDLFDAQQNVTYNTEQRLHYLGIPLQLGYQIWTSKRFRGYMAVGGQVEKLIDGKATILYSQDNLIKSTPVQDVSDKRLLFSALASVGIEYVLGKDLSLYAEPGVHYYFKNGNGLRTHYNEQPLNLNMTMGFRFHWGK